MYWRRTHLRHTYMCVHTCEKCVDAWVYIGDYVHACAAWYVLRTYVRLCYKCRCAVLVYLHDFAQCKQMYNKMINIHIIGYEFFRYVQNYRIMNCHLLCACMCVCTCISLNVSVQTYELLKFGCVILLSTLSVQTVHTL